LAKLAKLANSFGQHEPVHLRFAIQVAHFEQVAQIVIEQLEKPFIPSAHQFRAKTSAEPAKDANQVCQLFRFGTLEFASDHPITRERRPGLTMRPYPRNYPAPAATPAGKVRNLTVQLPLYHGK
jgi:hypothetical protein